VKLFRLDLPRLSEVQGYYSTVGHIASTSGRAIQKTPGEPSNAYAGSRSSHRRTRSRSSPTLFGPRGEGISAPEYIEPLDLHSRGDERPGNGGPIEAVPPNPRSTNMPSRTPGIRRSKTTGRAKKTAGQGEAISGRKRKLRRKVGEFRAFVAQVSPLAEIFACANPGTSNETKPPQLPATTAVTRGSTHFITVPQTPYKSSNGQEDWEGFPSIEFGGIRLTDALNLTYPGLQGSEDAVLNYPGVGSSISCRINVRRVFRIPDTSLDTALVFPSFLGAKSGGRR
jgi:hypothetical protein